MRGYADAIAVAVALAHNAGRSTTALPAAPVLGYSGRAGMHARQAVRVGDGRDTHRETGR